MDRETQRKLFVAGMLGLGVLAALPPPALGWGWDGHKVVCRIALARLQQDERDAVAALVAAYSPPGGAPYEQFSQGCVFADLARGNAGDGVPGWSFFAQFDSWHFLNLPRDAAHVAALHCGGDCVLEGIARHAAELADPQLPDWRRGQALLLLGHWVGDVHQPLHVSFADDRGGNQVRPIRGGYYYPWYQRHGNLHAVWDGGILDKAMAGTSWWDYADRLAGAITPAEATAWTAATPLEWAEESYAITLDPAVEYCRWRTTSSGEECARSSHRRRLGADYQGLFAAVVERRLQQAGVRLAEEIRRALP